MKLAHFFVAAAFAAAAGAVGAQEMSVEDSYLQESVEIQIVREQSNSDSREGKLVALEYIKDMLENGSKSKEIREILHHLSLEGTLNRERRDGRLANNYPDVRWKAAEYLGQFPAEEAAPILREIARADNEVSVVTEAIHSLRKCGAFDDDSVNAVLHIFRSYDAARPSDRLSLAVLSYFEDLPSPKSPVYDTLRNVSENPRYVKNIRDRAKTLLRDMMKKASSG